MIMIQKLQVSSDKNLRGSKRGDECTQHIWPPVFSHTLHNSNSISWGCISAIFMSKNNLKYNFCHYPASRCYVLKTGFSFWMHSLLFVPEFFVLCSNCFIASHYYYYYYYYYPTKTFTSGSCHACLLASFLLLLPSSSLPVSNASQTIPEVFPVQWSYL